MPQPLVRFLFYFNFSLCCFTNIQHIYAPLVSMNTHQSPSLPCEPKNFSLLRTQRWCAHSITTSQHCGAPSKIKWRKARENRRYVNDVFGYTSGEGKKTQAAFAVLVHALFVFFCFFVLLLIRLLVRAVRLLRLWWTVLMTRGAH